jgi:ABC-type branched-subunit amino acid transport system substrate-binding protein
VRRSILAVAAVAAAGLTLGACGTGDADESSAAGDSAAQGSVKAGPGVDVAAKTIRVGDLNALSGPAAALGKPVAAGHKAYFDALNARGGIDGWKIDLAVEDTGYQPQQHVQAFNALKSDIAILNSFGSPTTKAIQPQFQREKLVTVPASFDSIWGTDPTVAPVGTPYSIDVANALDYVTDGGAKKLKIGIIYQNDEYGADGLRGFEAAKEALGFDDAGRQSYKAGDTDFTAQVQKLKAAGAEAVVVTALPSATGPIVGTAATLGFTPQWILQGPSYIEQLITKDGTTGAEPTPVAAALKGAIVTSFSAPWGDEGAAGMERLIADQKKYAPDQPPSIYFALAYSQGKVVEEILRKAIAGGDLSRDGILAAKENLGEVDLGGITPAVTYTPEGGPPSRVSLITEIDPKVPGFLAVVEPEHGSEAAEGIDISA